MRVGSTAFHEGVFSCKVSALARSAYNITHLFEIVCQNFETNLDSILGLHEDINTRNIEPNIVEETFKPWNQFVDSLSQISPQPSLLSSKTSWTGRSQDKDKETENGSKFAQCLLWYKSSHKVVLLASNCPRLCPEDCLMLKDHIQFLLQAPILSQLPAAQVDSIDSGSASSTGGSSHGFVSQELAHTSAAESVLARASSPCTGAPQATTCFEDKVYLGQIDASGFRAGRQERRLFQNIFFEDKDGVLVLQSLLEHKPSGSLSASPSGSDFAQSSSSQGAIMFSGAEKERRFHEAVEAFKRTLANCFKSNPWSIFVHHNMCKYIMVYPGLVQFLCINRSCRNWLAAILNL
jgi:hypothetical protein